MIGVTREESRALDWLYGLVEAEEQLTARFKKDMLDVIVREGVKVDYNVDWRQVSGYLSPHLVLVIGQDSRRGEDTFPFPMYALLPASRMCLALDEDASYEVKAGPTDARRYVRDALNQLETAARSCDVGPRREAMRLLSALKRVLREA